MAKPLITVAQFTELLELLFRREREVVKIETTQYWIGYSKGYENACADFDKNTVHSQRGSGRHRFRSNPFI